MNTHKYDIFISYAVEDKLELALPFCEELENNGLKVWYSGRELRYGESIESVVKEGLEKSRYGIILITPHYFEKKWTVKELYSLWSMEEQGKNIILPVFHKVTPQEVAIHDIRLAERWAFNTEKGLPFIANEVKKVVKAELVNKQAKKKSQLILRSVLLIVLLALCFFGFKNYLKPQVIDEALVRYSVAKRINNYQSALEKNSQSYLKENKAYPIHQDKAISIHSSFDSIISKYRNHYEFNTGQKFHKFKKNVEPLAGVSFDTLSAVNNFGFQHPIINRVLNTNEKSRQNTELLYFNTQPIDFSILNTSYSDTLVIVSVNYQNNLRELSIKYQYGPETSYYKTITYQFKGIMPKEQYFFALENDQWQLIDVQ